MEENNRDPAKELWDGPNRRDLIETPRETWTNREEVFIAAGNTLATILKTIEEIYFDETKEGFRMEVYLDKKADCPCRVKIQMWDLTEPNGQREIIAQQNRKKEET